MSVFLLGGVVALAIILIYFGLFSPQAKQTEDIFEKYQNDRMRLCNLIYENVKFGSNQDDITKNKITKYSLIISTNILPQDMQEKLNELEKRKIIEQDETNLWLTEFGIEFIQAFGE